MRFLYAANTGDWSWDPAPEVRVPERSNRAFVMEVMQMYRTAVTAQMRGGGPLASATRLRSYADSLGNDPSARIALAWERHLSAALASRNASRDRAIQALKAHAMSDTIAPTGPPRRLITAELLGQLLLDAGRGAEAVAAFEQSLKLHPRRSNALLGLARARKMTGDTTGAARAYKDLLANWHAADADLPELDEVKAGAALAN
jgi:tetratricopeptide (TPR) repeat protein